MTKVLNQSDAHDILKTDEPASELFRRLICEQTLTGIETIDRHIQLRPGVLLEVCGPHGSGKSELLLQVSRTFCWSEARPALTRVVGMLSECCLMESCKCT